MGYYHSDARIQAADICPMSRRMADKLADKYPSVIMLLLDNKKLEPFVAHGGGQHPFELFVRHDKSWRREAHDKLAIKGGSSDSLRETFSSMLARNAHRQLVDFDEHLDDVSKDWCNPALASMGKMALPGQMA